MLLFRDRFAVSKPLSQIQRSTLSPLQDADPTPSFGGFGVTLDVIQLFKPFLEDAKITCDVQLYEGQLRVWGSVAALESILTNLITNAVNAFTQQQQAQLERRILVTTQVSENTLLISVKDNGPGITNLPVDEIWLPGRTSTPGGTGLGLTIVKDSVSDLGGDVHAIANGELGGAEIVVTLPLMGVEG